jgi:hypothetical protein
MAVETTKKYSSKSICNKLEKTIDVVIITNNGFKRLQTNPNFELLYLILRFTLENMYKSARDFLKCIIYLRF